LRDGGDEVDSLTAWLERPVFHAIGHKPGFSERILRRVRLPESRMNDKHKRAPTIDLTATEIDSKPAGAATSSATLPPEEGMAGPQAESRPPPGAQPPPDSRPHRLARQLIDGAPGALVGAVLAGAVFAALWFFVPSPRTPSGLQAEIASLQKQVQILQNRAPPAPDASAIAALRQRIVRIEHDIVQLPPGDKSVTERLASLDNATKSLGIALAALNRRGDDVAAMASEAQQHAAAAEKAMGELRSRVESAAKQAPATIDQARLDALQKQVAALEQSVTAARGQIAKTSVADGAARLALSVSFLRRTVESGAPYREALAQVKALGADDKMVAPLARFAETGLPSPATLGKELSGLIPAMRKSARAQKAPVGFLERLQANAGKLVHISPVNASAGNKPADVLTRLQADAAHADIAAALDDLAKLPAPLSAPAQSWIAKASARARALAAARQLAADTALALGARQAETGKP
jgi:hypothetical protein